MYNMYIYIYQLKMDCFFKKIIIYYSVKPNMLTILH